MMSQIFSLENNPFQSRLLFHRTFAHRRVHLLRSTFTEITALRYREDHRVLPVHSFAFPLCWYRL